MTDSIPSLTELREQHQKLIQQYNRLPRRESFSGWDYLEKIERIEKQIEELGEEL